MFWNFCLLYIQYFNLQKFKIRGQSILKVIQAFRMHGTVYRMLWSRDPTYRLYLDPRLLVQFLLLLICNAFYSFTYSYASFSGVIKS